MEEMWWPIEHWKPSPREFKVFIIHQIIHESNCNPPHTLEHKLIKTKPDKMEEIEKLAQETQSLVNNNVCTTTTMMQVIQ